jgi:hypothetical protein
MLIAEIIGTIVVWRRGWGPWALLPIIGALIAGPVILAMTGVVATVFVADLGCIVALATMYANGYEPIKASVTPARPAPIPAAPAVQAEQHQAA